MLASELGGEIVNFDSVQIYRGFDIGSAKPGLEERGAVPHHLYDVVLPSEHFDAASHAEAASSVITEIRSRGNVPILVGGTNFYLRALLHGLPSLPPRDERLRRRLTATLDRPGGRRALHRWLGRVDRVAADQINPSDSHRLIRALEVWMLERRPISSRRPPMADSPPRFEAVRFALELDRETLRNRIHERAEQMYANGLVEETRLLLDSWNRQCRPFGSIGYREAVSHIRDGLSISDAIALTKSRSWQFARRQLSWLRGERDVQRIDLGRGLENARKDTVRLYRSKGSK